MRGEVLGLYLVAERLGMTVSELRDRMTPAELAGWCEFLKKQARKR